MELSFLRRSNVANITQHCGMKEWCESANSVGEGDHPGGRAAAKKFLFNTKNLSTGQASPSIQHPFFNWEIILHMFHLGLSGYFPFVR
ncbi:hypothetical protein Ancab_019966 [Ancistrocladus abbreviatus]